MLKEDVGILGIFCFSNCDDYDDGCDNLSGEDESFIEDDRCDSSDTACDDCYDNDPEEEDE